MATLYLTQRDVELRKDGERLVISRAGVKLQDIPLVQVERLVVLGSVGVTGPVVDLLMQHRIPVAFLNHHGSRFRARLEPGFSRNARLRRAQYEAAFCDQRTLGLARDMVRGKLRNCRALLRRIAREREAAPAIRAAADRITALLRRLPSAATANEVRGVEGAAARAYFAAWDEVLAPSGLSFPGRTRRPPRDPVNAVLSFGYGLLLALVDGWVSAVGLDPYQGYLHTIRHGKPSLSLDLMEEFRPVLVDRLVFALLNRRRLQKEDFQERLGGVELTETGRRTFLQAWEELLESDMVHPITGETVTWRRCVELQVRFFSKGLLDGLPHYEPFRFR